MATVVTKGWDLIAGITQKSLNTLIAQAFAKGVIPNPINETLDLGLLGKAAVSVTIGSPTVDLNPAQAQGQSGFVGFIFPIVSGSISVNGGAATPIPPGTLEIITVIKYITVEFSGGSNETLSLDFTSPLAVYNVIITEPTWPPSLTSVLESALQQFFTGLTPGAINLGTVTIPSVATALAPVGEADFAIQTASDPNQNALLLLMITTSGTRPTGPGAVDFSNVSPLIPSDQSAGLYVSNRALLQEIIIPQLASSLNLQSSSFSLQGNATTPYTATFSGDQKISGEYDPELTNLSMYVNDNQQVQGGYSVHAHPLFNAGDTYYVEVDGNMFVSFDLNGQTISFKTTSDSGTGSIKASAWGWVIVAAAIIASFGTLGVFIGIVLAIVVPIVITQLKFPISLPGPLLAEINQALGSFTWPAQKNFPLTSIQMPGDVVFFGTPQF